MIRIVSEWNCWPLKWDRIGICSSRDKGGVLPNSRSPTPGKAAVGDTSTTRETPFGSAGIKRSKTYKSFGLSSRLSNSTQIAAKHWRSLFIGVGACDLMMRQIACSFALGVQVEEEGQSAIRSPKVSRQGGRRKNDSHRFEGSDRFS